MARIDMMGNEVTNAAIHDEVFASSEIVTIIIALSTVFITRYVIA